MVKSFSQIRLSSTEERLIRARALVRQLAQAMENGDDEEKQEALRSYRNWENPNAKGS